MPRYGFNEMDITVTQDEMLVAVRRHLDYLVAAVHFFAHLIPANDLVKSYREDYILPSGIAADDQGPQKQQKVNAKRQQMLGRLDRAKQELFILLREQGSSRGKVKGWLHDFHLLSSSILYQLGYKKLTPLQIHVNCSILHRPDVLPDSPFTAIDPYAPLPPVLAMPNSVGKPRIMPLPMTSAEQNQLNEMVLAEALVGESTDYDSLYTKMYTEFLPPYTRSNTAQHVPQQIPPHHSNGFGPRNTRQLEWRKDGKAVYGIDMVGLLVPYALFAQAAFYNQNSQLMRQRINDITQQNIALLAEHYRQEERKQQAQAIPAHEGHDAGVVQIPTNTRRSEYCLVNLLTPGQLDGADASGPSTTLQADLIERYNKGHPDFHFYQFYLGVNDFQKWVPFTKKQKCANETSMAALLLRLNNVDLSVLCRSKINNVRELYALFKEVVVSGEHIKNKNAWGNHKEKIFKLIKKINQGESLKGLTVIDNKDEIEAIQAVVAALTACHLFYDDVWYKDEHKFLLQDCILYMSRYLRIGHATGCKSVLDRTRDQAAHYSGFCELNQWFGNNAQVFDINNKLHKVALMKYAADFFLGIPCWGGPAKGMEVTKKTKQRNDDYVSGCSLEMSKMEDVPKLMDGDPKRVSEYLTAEDLDNKFFPDSELGLPIEIHADLGHVHNTPQDNVAKPSRNAIFNKLYAAISKVCDSLPVTLAKRERLLTALAEAKRVVNEHSEDTSFHDAKSIDTLLRLTIPVLLERHSSDSKLPKSWTNLQPVFKELGIQIRLPLYRVKKLSDKNLPLQTLSEAEIKEWFEQKIYQVIMHYCDKNKYVDGHPIRVRAKNLQQELALLPFTERDKLLIFVHEMRDLLNKGIGEYFLSLFKEPTIWMQIMNNLAELYVEEDDIAKVYNRLQGQYFGDDDSALDAEAKVDEAGETSFDRRASARHSFRPASIYSIL